MRKMVNNETDTAAHISELYKLPVQAIVGHLAHQLSVKRQL
jgi:hypothetical protein